MGNSVMMKGLFIVYCLLLSVSLWQHEMWRDELEAWNIAVASNSISDLFTNFQYEGHPVLWFIILWLTSKINMAPEAMQIVHFFFAAATAWLILLRSPFSVFQKIMLVFGYYFLYEYAAISRNYMMEVMMVIAICSMWKNSGENRILLLFLLFIICQTNAFGYVFSFAFAFSLFIKELTDHKKFLSPSLYLLASVIGFVIAIKSAELPADSELTQYFYTTYDRNRLYQVFTNAFNGLVPLPVFRFPMWSEPLVGTSATGALMGIILIAAIGFISVKEKKLLLTFLLPLLLALLAFMYFLYPGFQRHHGHIFIALVSFIWLARSTAEKKTESKSYNLSEISFNILLLWHAIAGAAFCLTDWLHPFSPAKETATFISKTFPAAQPVAGFTDCPITSVAGYLQRDVYFLNNMRHASFVLYKKGRQNTEDSTVCKNLFALADTSEKVVVVLNYRLNYNGLEFLPDPGESKSIRFMVAENEREFLIKNFFTSSKGMVGGEDFTVYELQKLR